MIIELTYNSKNYLVNLSKPIDLSIPINNGQRNPNCYYSPIPIFQTIESENFIGSVKDGGMVNHKKIQITPHGNGTHTETYGHLVDDDEATISRTFKGGFFIAELISLEPTAIHNSDDKIISLEAFQKCRKHETEAVIIRTNPNDESKMSRNYSGSNPPYLDKDIATLLNKNGVKHLLVDLPSIDKEIDEGRLDAHKLFWGLPNKIRKECTITELIFADNTINDGLYLLDIQTLNIELDVSPSRPIAYRLENK